VALFGCETWSLTLEEEHRLRVFENGALRRIFGPKRDEGIGGWRNHVTRKEIKSHVRNEELHNLCFSRIIRMIKPKKMRWDRQGM
jgi:hypothetical protein